MFLFELLMLATNQPSCLSQPTGHLVFRNQGVGMPPPQRWLVAEDKLVGWLVAKYKTVGWLRNTRRLVVTGERFPNIINYTGKRPQARRNVIIIEWTNNTYIYIYTYKYIYRERENICINIKIYIHIYIYMYIYISVCWRYNSMIKFNATLQFNSTTHPVQYPYPYTIESIVQLNWVVELNWIVEILV